MPRRVVTKVEWHPGELYPRVGFIVTNLSRPVEDGSKGVREVVHGGSGGESCFGRPWLPRNPPN